MRYFTKQLFVSSQFYHVYRPDLEHMNLESYVLREILRNDYPKNLIQGTQLVNESYRKHVQKTFNDEIFNSIELKKVIFDNEGNIKLLDDDIFIKIMMYTAKYTAISFEAINQDRENKTKIESGNYSKGVKYLSKFCQHDHEIKFEINESFIVLTDNYSDTKVFVFKPINDSEINFFNDTEFTVLDTEVVVNDNGTFQYNVLGYRSDNGVNNGLSDITIEFSNVELK